jgi:hypothetical protein
MHNTVIQPAGLTFKNYALDNTYIPERMNDPFIQSRFTATSLKS